MSPLKRLAGEFVKKIASNYDTPLKKLAGAADAQAIGFDLNSPEPDPVQRFKNAVIVGGGGIAASAATGGLDVIPFAVELYNEMAKQNDWPRGPREVQDALDSAPLFNPENYLRLAAYGGDHTETKQILTDAMEAQGRVQARIPRAGGLMIPMNSSGF